MSPNSVNTYILKFQNLAKPVQIVIMLIVVGFILRLMGIIFWLFFDVRFIHDLGGVSLYLGLIGGVALLIFHVINSSPVENKNGNQDVDGEVV